MYLERPVLRINGAVPSILPGTGGWEVSLQAEGFWRGRPLRPPSMFPTPIHGQGLSGGAACAQLWTSCANALGSVAHPVPVARPPRCPADAHVVSPDAVAPNPRPLRGDLLQGSIDFGGVFPRAHAASWDLPVGAMGCSGDKTRQSAAGPATPPAQEHPLSQREHPPPARRRNP